MKLIRMASAHAHARSQATNAMSRPELSAKKRNHAAAVQQIKVRSFQPAPAGSGLGYSEGEGHRRRKDRQRPENKKGILKQAIDLVTGPASTATINLAADLKSTHELISDVFFQPQHADNHSSENQQPKVRSAAVASIAGE